MCVHSDIDTPKRPKVDGIACPETDEYNVLVTTLEKEKKTSFFVCSCVNSYTEDVPQNQTTIMVIV